MKFCRILMFSILSLMIFPAFTLKDKDKDKAVYVFGLAASFTDSVVYYTPIQKLDSVKIQKNGFLPKRSAYSSQLKSYIENTLNRPNYTCMIYFSENKSKLEKEAQGLKNRYRQQKAVIQDLGADDFSFKKPAD